MNESEIIKIATEARQEAYAPYSDFRVGAAILCEDGRVFSGANVENSVYGLSMCAERIAATKAVTEGCRKFKAIAIVAGGPTPCPPCGACRQFLAEFGLETQVVMANTNGDITRTTLKDLLPVAFTNEQLVDKGAINDER